MNAFRSANEPSRWLLILLVALGLAVAGCAGGNQGSPTSTDTGTADTGLAAIPAPSQLGRSSSELESKLLGDQYGHDWPSQLVTSVEPGILRFEPDSDYSAGTDGMAWAIYQPAIPEPDEYFLFDLTWNEAPADYSDYWIGLADFNRDSWDWFRLPETNRFPVSPAANVADGSTYCVIACGGNSPSELMVLFGQAAAAPDEVAPDFTLKLVGEERYVTLSDFRGERPVVLMLGSYT